VTDAMGVRKLDGMDGPERSKGCEETYVNVAGDLAESTDNGRCTFLFCEVKGRRE